MRNFGFAGYDRVIYPGHQRQDDRGLRRDGPDVARKLDRFVAANRGNYHLYRPSWPACRASRSSVRRVERPTISTSCYG